MEFLYSPLLLACLLVLEEKVWFSVRLFIVMARACGYVCVLLEVANRGAGSNHTACYSSQGGHWKWSGGFARSRLCICAAVCVLFMCSGGGALERGDVCA